MNKKSMTMRKAIKLATEYRGSADTSTVRSLLQLKRREGWPYCPADQGDLLYFLAKSAPDQDALEVGFATGSTALYILSGLDSGKLISIDYAQDAFDREGVSLIQQSGFASRHQLIEENSIAALPKIYGSGQQFNLIFLDGWKTFDHVWVDTFYCARMLRVGGHIVFDDARMQAVRKCISLLRRYYDFEPVDSYAKVGGLRQRIWHVLTTRSLHPPYAVLKKAKPINETEAGRRYDFWKPF